MTKDQLIKSRARKIVRMLGRDDLVDTDDEEKLRVILGEYMDTDRADGERGDLLDDNAVYQEDRQS